MARNVRHWIGATLGRCAVGGKQSGSGRKQSGSLAMKDIRELIKQQVVLGDGGYLIELERRGYVDSGSGREKVGTGRGSGQFTPEVAIENPDALRELHREFLSAGAQVLQALTFFGTREK